VDKIRVLLTKRYFQEDISYLRRNLVESVELIQPAGFTSEAIAQAARDDVHVLLGDHVAKETLDNAKGLRLIQIPWTGVDRLDFELLNKYPVVVCNSHSNAGIVAEYAVGLMMAIVKKIPFHDKQLRLGKWMRPRKNSTDSFFPPDVIAGKTIGFVGYGAIARKITQLLSGFGVSFMAVDARQTAPPPEPLQFLGAPNQAAYVMAQSDIVFVAVPLTAKTAGMINGDLLKRMKPSAYLINISRGEVVNESDLYDTLKERLIAGAAVDTWFDYPTEACPDTLPSTYPFHELDNLVLSPHRAGFAGGLLPHLDDAIENINRLATGRPLVNCVNPNDGF